MNRFYNDDFFLSEYFINDNDPFNAFKNIYLTYIYTYKYK